MVGVGVANSEVVCRCDVAWVEACTIPVCQVIVMRDTCSFHVIPIADMASPVGVLVQCKSCAVLSSADGSWCFKLAEDGLVECRRGHSCRGMAFTRTVSWAVPVVADWEGGQGREGTWIRKASW